MQPTFLPWAGYFRLMNEADAFVLLDDVQLAKQSWQTRNRVLVNGRVHWITVPIQHAGIHQTIAETRIEQARHWRIKSARMLDQAYARHPHVGDLREIFAEIENGTDTLLVDLNCSLTAYCSNKLGIFAPLRRASRMALTSSDRTERLIEICGLLECDTYLSPTGAAEYLAEDEFIERGTIQLQFANYNPPTYSQKGASQFVSHLSIIDAVANLGWEGCASYVRAQWPKQETPV
jgi:WbqC-like protein family